MIVPDRDFQPCSIELRQSIVSDRSRQSVRLQKLLIASRINVISIDDRRSGMLILNESYCLMEANWGGLLDIVSISSKTQRS